MLKEVEGNRIEMSNRLKERNQAQRGSERAESIKCFLYAHRTSPKDGAEALGI